ncbi:MAG: hypothetical protein K2X42_10020 [Burkholderiaceae bacterium]|jgi:hypothetical protein|nr:hypothetical protein [Burkholderiaceae bacterium]
MPLSWSTLPDSQLCIVSGEGTVTRSDIYTYLARTIAEGTKGYAKLVDITACTLALNSDDLDTVAHRLMQYGRGDRPGPVAMVVGSALTLDMAVLLKQKAGDRPFRIFTSVGAARSWLKSYQESYDPVALSTGISTRSRSLRAV